MMLFISLSKEKTTFLHYLREKIYARTRDARHRYKKDSTWKAAKEHF